jgi:prolyl-tRNA synthetase
MTVKTKDEDRAKILAKAQEMRAQLKEAGIRVKVDDRDNCTPGFKYNHWELKVFLIGI